jgi:hypothetical protein
MSTLYKEPDPQAALEWMRIPLNVGATDFAGAYAVNLGQEPRMTIHSQQVRAFTLAGELGRRLRTLQQASSKAARVGIVGAGASGCTAATVLALSGHEVCLFEKNEEPMEGPWRTSPRYVNPHLFEFPEGPWWLKRSNLPLMSWTANSGKEVFESLVKQFAIWRSLLGANVNYQKLHSVELSKAGLERMVKEWQLDAVILAVGFGPELLNDGSPSQWEARIPLADLRTRGFAKEYSISISGSGDGAYSDVIAYSLMLQDRPVDEEALRELVMPVYELIKDKATKSLTDHDGHGLPEDLYNYAREEIKKVITEKIRRSGLRVLHHKRNNKPRAHFELNEILYEDLKRLEILIAENEPIGAITRHGTDDRALKELKKLQDNHRSMGTAQYDTGWRVARHRPRPVLSKDRTRPVKRIYSDLFDSTVQRKLFENLRSETKEKEPIVPEGVFGAVYREYINQWIEEGEVEAEIEFIITDSQFYDGIWFLNCFADLLKPLSSAEGIKFIIRERTGGFRAALQKNKKFGISGAWGHISPGAPISGEERGENNPVWTRYCEQQAALENLFESSGGTIERQWWTPHDPAWPFNMQKCFEDAAAFVLQLNDENSRPHAEALYKEAVRTKALESARALFNAQNATLSMKSDAVGMLSWYERAYNRTLALQHGATIFETCYRHESLWLARALMKDHFTGINVNAAAPSVDMAAFNVQAIRKIGSERRESPKMVPDAGMSGAIVPYEISWRGALKDTGPDVSLVEHFDSNALEEYYGMQLDPVTLRPIPK